MFRHILIKLILLLHFSIALNAQVEEDFSDGDFTSNPTWVGDVTNWKIVGLQLNSNSPITYTQSYISTLNTLAQNTQWLFTIDLKFATSSVNYLDVFLISDSANLLGMNSGIFVRVGNTSDEISLYRKDGNVNTKIIDGLDGRVGSTTNNLFRIKVTRGPNNEFKLYDDASGTGNAFALEGSALENSYQSSSWYGFLIKFSSANTQKFFFDDITVSPLVVDTFAPIVDSVWATDSAECMVQFNEETDSSAATSLSNYTLNGTISPISVKRKAGSNRQIILQFASPFTANALNVIQIANVKDISGNVMTHTTKTFKYGIIQIGDIVINEIFPDPSPQIGMPAYEFIELWNTSGRDINLLGLSISDGSSTAIFPSYVLAKDSFVVVSSTASLNAYAGFGGSIVLANFPSLNNDGDHIELLNKQGQEVDEVSYDLGYYNNNLKSDGGWSLELIHPKLRCKKRYNWKASMNALLGGTPGHQNSVYEEGADTIAPTIAKFELLNDSTCWIVFSTSMDSLSLSAISIGTSQSIVEKKVGNRNSDSLLLSFVPLQNQVNYSFIFSVATSCNGIPMRPQLISFKYDKSFHAQFNGIVISEVLVNPSASLTALPNSQFIELHNRGGYSVNLSGMKISDGTSNAILPYYKLMSDSFILVAPSTKATEFIAKNIPALYVSSFPYLNIDNDHVYLTDSSNVLINTMHYDTRALNNLSKSKGGWAMELVDENNSCLTEGNWIYSTHPDGGTPNKPNSVKAILNDPSKLSFTRAYTLGLDEVVLVFNKAIDLNASKLLLHLELLPTVVGGFELSYHQNKINEISFKLNSGSWAKEVIYKITITGLEDCGGKHLDSMNAFFGYPSNPMIGDIVINEILFDAPSYGSEFVELYNTSDKIFDLSATTLTSYNKSGFTGGAIATSNVPLQLLPGKYIALCADHIDIQKRFYSPSPENVFTTADWETLDDDSGVLILSNLNTSASIDSAYYSKNWHHPFIANAEGVSLERVNFKREDKTRNNWLSAASSVGYATPAYQNSKYSDKVAPDQFVFLTKAYFTPDNDGMDDELSFTLVLPSQNFAITITVFDIHGNEIKKLARNEIAAVSNYYTWDGSTSSGELAPVGHYVLFIQAVDTNGKGRAEKEVVDLLMR